MARKIKISNEQQKRFARVEEKRKKDIRTKRKYYLIVCEGEETEPNYFEGLKNDLPKGVLTYFQIDIEGTGYNTQSLLIEALRLRKLYEEEYNRPIDRLWVVFDKDSFSADNFNSAITRCQNSRLVIGCAWSNEAFELWYLLHFHYCNNGLNRVDYQRLLEENLKAFVGENYKYLKNSIEIYELLKKHASIETAVRNAKMLAANFEGRQDYANHNPCTMVYKLVEELLELKNKG